MNTEASVGGVNAAHASAKDGPVAVPAPPTLPSSGKRPSRPQDPFVSDRLGATPKVRYDPPNRVQWAMVMADLERYRAALERIANEDYRGSRPWSATVAREALDA